MRTLLLGLLLVVTAGCSSGVPRVLTPNEGVREEIRDLRAQLLELQKKAAVSEVEVARLREKVATLEADAGGAPASSAPSSTASVSPPRPVASPVEDRLPVAVQPRPVIIEQTLDEEPAEPIAARPLAEVVPPAPSPSMAAVTETKPVPVAGQALYDRGYTLYHQGQYVEAEASFQRFLQGFGDTDLADNALYWIGEARFARRDFRGALAAFRETVDRYPAGNKLPDSLLKAGDALERLGDIEGARASYREVERRFAESATALIAAERLSKLP
jgi:tol-pal system protein YbgF